MNDRLSPDLRKQIVDCLAPLHPDRVVLFGSYASGTPGPDSDLDLYVVTSDERMPVTWSEKQELTAKTRERLRTLRQTIPMDILVHTRAMFRKFTELDSLFARRILNYGVVLYDAQHQ